MKVELWAKKYRPIYIDTLIWSGKMDSVPRVGDTVFPYDGWGGVKVARVFWNLTDKTVELSFDDRNGEYTNEAVKRESSSPSNSKSEDIECTYINNGVCISNQYPGHQCEPPQDNLPQEATSLDDNYQAVQKILLDWNNGRRPLSGEVRDILAWHKAEITKLLQVIEDELNNMYELSITDLELRQHQQGVEIPVLGKTELLEALKKIKDTVINGGSL